MLSQQSVISPDRVGLYLFELGFLILADLVNSGDEAIGKLLRAGTNCGSCIPELQELLTVKIKHPASA